MPPPPAPLDASRLTVTPNRAYERVVPDVHKLGFLTTFAPHMLVVDWDADTGWSDPQIVPYANLQVSPAAPALHYASCLFEGLKAYRAPAPAARDQVLLFRPEMNMARMNRSAQRLGLPTFDGAEAVKLIRRLVQTDCAWVPPGGGGAGGGALYVRPALIGTTASLAVHTPRHAKLFVITSPVAGSYFAPVARAVGTPPRGVRLLARADVARAWTNGTGAYKLGANYGPTFVLDEQAQAAGYDQILWIFNGEITEVGAMNFFVVLARPPRDDDDASSQSSQPSSSSSSSSASPCYEVATAPLDGGYILPGITRDSVLTLLREHAAGLVRLPGLPAPSTIRVSERRVRLDEVLQASREGRLVEAFGTGTAAIVAPVEEIGWQGTAVPVPTASDDGTDGTDGGGGGGGTFARVLLKELSDRQCGVQSHPGWSVAV